MKICTKCNKEKLLTEFSWKNKEKNQLSPSCKECHREYSKTHYTNDKQYYRSKNKKHRDLKAEYIKSKREVPCADCGKRFPFYMMQFDHLDPTKKEFNIARMCNNSWRQIKEEIAKCEVVCANHHTERTYLRNN